MTHDIHDMGMIDRAVMLVSTGLMLLGIVVLGLVETMAGEPYRAAPLTNEAGEVVATPLVDPNLRVGLVVLGLAIMAVYAAYRMVKPAADAEESAGATMTT